MSTERLIEEAERLAASFRDPEKKRNLHLAQTLTDLVTALRSEREQGKATTISLRCAEANLKASEERARKAENERDEIGAGLRSSSNLNFAMRQERDEYAAANLAANKRIVALEHELAAARAELARLTTPRPIAEAPRDGTWVLGLWWGRAIPVVVQWTEGSGWTDGEYDLKPTLFLPLRFEERSPPEGARDDG